MNVLGVLIGIAGESELVKDVVICTSWRIDCLVSDIAYGSGLFKAVLDNVSIDSDLCSHPSILVTNWRVLACI